MTQSVSKLVCLYAVLAVTIKNDSIVYTLQAFRYRRGGEGELFLFASAVTPKPAKTQSLAVMYFFDSMEGAKKAIDCSSLSVASWEYLGVR